MDDTELTKLALEILKDFENSSTKSNIDPSDSYMLELDEDIIFPIQTYDTQHNEVGFTYPKESDTLHGETITIISNTSGDSLHDILPPIPSPKQPKSLIISIAGNKKRGIKRWAKRQKLLYTSPHPRSHSELTKKINEYIKSDEYEKTKKQRTRSKKYNKKKRKYKKNKYKPNDSKQFAMDIGINNPNMRRNSYDQYNNASVGTECDLNQCITDNDQCDNALICNENDSTRCIMDGEPAVKITKSQQNISGQYDKTAFCLLALIPMDTNDYEDNKNPFRGEDIMNIKPQKARKTKKKKKKKKRKKRKKEETKFKILHTKRGRNRKARKVVSAPVTPMSRLNAIL